MSKNIFIDCGTHHCEGIKEFLDRGIINDTFEIHTFEANTECNVQERIKDIPLNITAYNKAVWVEDGWVTFFQEDHTHSGSGSPSDGTSNIDGWGSSIEETGFFKEEYINYPSIKVESIDFNKFLKTFPDDYYIVCKIDIEGSEFPVLRKLIHEKTLSKINLLYVEFHEWGIDIEDSESVNKIKEEALNLGVNIYDWH
jgi:FkbM family methyltransferase|tara:strand:+ start:992 stop:1585 length:594 start_codon:yes stop_codon:yes gene_type:complete